jgi:nucleoside-diphosphate-sugar epimerase
MLGEEALAKRSGTLPITVIRPGIVFGPHETNFAAMFQSIQWTRLHAMMGFCSPRLSLIHVADLVSLVLSAAERGHRLPPDRRAADGTGFYHACDDREFPTHAQLGRRIARALGTSALILPLPTEIAFPAAGVIEAYWNFRGQASIVSPDKVREAIATSWAASAARARRHLGFAPGASLDTRLAETASWLKHAGCL